MSIIAEAAERLTAAVKTVDGLRGVHTNPSAIVRRPAAMVGPPRLQWASVCTDPTSATFVVIVVVEMDEHAVGRLWELVPRVSAAVDELLPEAAVTTANPGVFNSGGTDLPSYEITVEVSL